MIEITTGFQLWALSGIQSSLIPRTSPRLERAVFGTLFNLGFKKNAEATDEEKQASSKLRSEHEAAEAKELSDKAKGKQRRRRRRRKIQPAGRQPGRPAVGLDTKYSGLRSLPLHQIFPRSVEYLLPFELV